MNEVVLHLILFVLLNVLDGFTTWLGLHALPTELRGKEANPLFKDAEKTFASSMIKKGVLVLFGVWLFYHLADVFALRVVNLAFVVVVVNNLYVYVSRKITGRKLPTPTGAFTTLLRRLCLPERVARLLGFYVLFGLVIVSCYFIVWWVS